MTLTEGSLHKWFKGSKSKDGKGGWVNVVTGGTCASDKPGEGTPKCVSSSKRASMSKSERLSAARRKKKADPGQQQKSGAAKPTYVRTDAKKKMKEEKELKTIAKELDGAVIKHKSQADRIRKHIKGMKEEVKLSSKKNCGCGQNPCITYGKKELTQAQDVEEACWKGYEKKGMKTMFGKRYPNCVKKTKKEEVELQIDERLGEEQLDETPKGDVGKDSETVQRRRNEDQNRRRGDRGSRLPDKAQELRRSEHKMRRGAKTGPLRSGKQPDKLSQDVSRLRRITDKFASQGHRKEEVELDERLGGKGYKPYTSMSGKRVSGDYEDSDRGAGNKAKKRAGGKVEKKSPTFQAYLINKEEVELDEADKKGKGSGTKDACYHKVKSRYSVWPSAYASGALVKCRKVGAANWGNSTKKESYSWRDSFEWEQLDEGAAWTKKEGKNKSGGLNEKGRKSYERDNPGSDLKAPSKKVGNPRRKSFCARMKGMKRKLTSAKTARDPDSRINKSLRAWNC